MVDVYVGVGSNVDRERKLRAGVAALRDAFGPLRLSSVWDTVAVGFDGDPFLNLVVCFATGRPVVEVARILDGIETAFGRTRDQKGKASSRTLDLDLLLYGDAMLSGVDVRVPRDEILEYAFVLAPLAELAPDLRHPVVGRTYRELWNDFDGDRSGLRHATMEMAG